MSEEWVPFRTKCPSCNNNEVISWEHCKGFGEKINRNGEIKCENPNCHMFSKPKFISELSFNCGQHHGEGRKPDDPQRLISVFSTFSHFMRKNELKKFLVRIIDDL